MNVILGTIAIGEGQDDQVCVCGGRGGPVDKREILDGLQKYLVRSEK